MTTNEMWQAAKLMKASRSSDQRIAGAELERLARIYELAEAALRDKYSEGGCCDKRVTDKT